MIGYGPFNNKTGPNPFFAGWTETLLPTFKFHPELEIEPYFSAKLTNYSFEKSDLCIPFGQIGD